ncbi:hypothetical protein THASP1DRAFT_31513 [Thamnocephalis sphaerospora]|uniref:SCP domain-containing protein n=1 Tax=Thamnocephalis sphaerospora TaxID=78915 RepID=A0A4P9XLJ4_9FUNG|nr:hypothetical protein THASP1DRAFT_31513 [Thamnocephalis sphaerospora]|eukprot:RKP06676.1 hypothetical protein THASP1DRAFT_31513 [Thamnocephalis sphaerospora]
MSARMLALVNEERRKHGKRPLAHCDCLVAASMAHSREQARANKMGHQMPGEPDLLKRVRAVSKEGQWTSYAENVGAGSEDAATLMRSWIKSPKHHANLLGAHTHFGAAMAVSASGKPYWTQVFANNGTMAEDGKLVSEHHYAKHQSTSAAVVAIMLKLVNRERAQHGLRALAEDSCLNQAAQLHSDAQGQAATMTHQLPDEPDLITRVSKVSEGKRRWTGWAENVGFGSKNEELIMEKWMESPKHRANILGDHTHFGTAMAMGVDGKPYWTQVFANDGRDQVADKDDYVQPGVTVLIPGQGHSLPSPPTSPCDETPADEQLHGMLQLVNEERRKAGKTSVELDVCLIRAAQLHSEAQAEAGKMSHQLPAEADLVTRVNAVSGQRRWMGWAENVGFGSEDPRVVMSMWINSPQHRDNILGNYTHLGVGVAHRNGKPYWTQVFGTRAPASSNGTATDESTTAIEYVVSDSNTTASGSTAESNADRMKTVLRLVNAARTQAGKAPLAWDAQLGQAAYAHSVLQAKANEMSHRLTGEADLVTRVNKATTGRRWAGWAENVGFGSTNVDVVMNMWLNSPKHRENILGEYTHFGVAEARDKHNKPYWTQVFTKIGTKSDDESCVDNDVYITEVVELNTPLNKLKVANKPTLSPQHSDGSVSRPTSTGSVFGTPPTSPKKSFGSAFKRLSTRKSSSNSLLGANAAPKPISNGDSQTSKSSVKHVFRSFFSSFGRSSGKKTAPTH